MSVKVKYKGTEIASASTEVTKTLQTAGKYCEADIIVENTPDSGDEPVINPLSVTENGTYTAPSGVDGYSPVTVNVQGITPIGTKNITDTSLTDVTNYANAQVVDANLVAGNIKKDVNILGILGAFEGGGGGLPAEINELKYGEITLAEELNSDLTISVGLTSIKGFVLCIDDIKSAQDIQASTTVYYTIFAFIYKFGNAEQSISGINPDLTSDIFRFNVGLQNTGTTSIGRNNLPEFGNGVVTIHRNNGNRRFFAQKYWWIAWN